MLSNHFRKNACKFIASVLFMLVSFVSFGQERIDTTYYDKDWKGVSNRAFADFYRVAMYPDNALYKKQFQDYYITGELLSTEGPNIQNTFFGCKFGDNVKTVKDILKQKGYAIVKEHSFTQVGSRCNKLMLTIGYVEFGGTSFDKAVLWFTCDHFCCCDFSKTYKKSFDAINQFNWLKHDLENKYGLFEKSNINDSYGYNDNKGDYINVDCSNMDSETFEVSLYYVTYKYEDSTKDEL